MFNLMKLLKMMEQAYASGSIKGLMKEMTGLDRLDAFKQARKKVIGMNEMNAYFKKYKNQISKAVDTLTERDAKKLLGNTNKTLYDAVIDMVKDPKREAAKKLDPKRMKDQMNYAPKRVISSWIEWVSYDNHLKQMKMKVQNNSTVYVFPFFPKKIFLKMRNTKVGAGTILWKEYWHKFGNRGIAKEGLGTKQAANIIANNPHLNKLLKKNDPLTKLTKQFNKQLKGTGVRVPRPTRTKSGGIKWK